jgi:hypothetical protein
MHRLPCPECATDDWTPIVTGASTTVFACAACGLSEHEAALTRMIEALGDFAMEPAVHHRLAAAVAAELGRA